MNKTILKVLMYLLLILPLPSIGGNIYGSTHNRNWVVNEELINDFTSKYTHVENIDDFQAYGHYEVKNIIKKVESGDHRHPYTIKGGAWQILKSAREQIHKLGYRFSYTLKDTATQSFSRAEQSRMYDIYSKYVNRVAKRRIGHFGGLMYKYGAWQLGGVGFFKVYTYEYVNQNIILWDNTHKVGEASTDVFSTLTNNMSGKLKYKVERYLGEMYLKMCIEAGQTANAIWWKRLHSNRTMTIREFMQSINRFADNGYLDRERANEFLHEGLHPVVSAWFRFTNRKLHQRARELGYE